MKPMGGKRPGSGRKPPPEPKKSRTLYVTEMEYRELKRVLEELRSKPQ